MHPDGITEAVHAAVPEMLDHFLRADDPVAVKQKIFQKCAFFPGESQRRAIYTGFSCTCVKGNAAASQADILLDKFASGKAADAGFQLFEMKWLGEVIVGAGIESGENRSIGIEGTELTQDFQTVNSRQVQIQKDQVVILCHT